MSYKTILVHVDATPLAAQRIRIAAKLARSFGAHLIGTATSGFASIVRQAQSYDMATIPAPVECGSQRDSARAALAEFDAIAAACEAPSCERRLIDEDADDGLMLQARYSDLVVVGQAGSGFAQAGVGDDMAEFVMLHGARPVLIIPYAGKFEHVGQRILVAWDGGQEASRAIVAALPLLQKATQVTLVVFNADGRDGIHGDVPGADIALYLARHQVRVDVREEHVGFDIGNAMLSLATDIDADLIVMGGYGHARLRQLLLGGVTRTVLRTMTVPVLMAH